jgi:hypothetical protein
VNDTARELGSATGIAVMGSVLNQQYRDGLNDALHGLAPAVANQAQNSVAFTQSGEIKKLGSAGARLVATAEHSFVHGISSSLLIAAAIVALTAAVVAALPPKGVFPADLILPEDAVITAQHAVEVTSRARPAADHHDPPDTTSPPGATARPGFHARRNVEEGSSTRGWDDRSSSTLAPGPTSIRYHQVRPPPSGVAEGLALDRTTRLLPLAGIRFDRLNKPSGPTNPT